MAARDEPSGAGPVRVSAVLGNVADQPWCDTLAAAHVDVIRLDQAEAQKSRLRRRTEDGADVAIALDRRTLLRDGDVLHWDAAHRSALVARIELQDVLIIDLTALLAESRQASMARCVELGHALGNQHWAAVVKGSHVYVPLTVAQDVMGSVLDTHALEGISYAFAPGADVIPQLAPHEARRLFGASQGHMHSAPAGAEPA